MNIKPNRFFRPALKQIDAQGVRHPDPPKPLPQMSSTGRYLKYEDVPWYRREPGALAFLGVLFCGFVTVALCIICLTGDVYKKSYDAKGNLNVWGPGNKIAAILILVLQIFLYWVYQQMGHK